MTTNHDITQSNSRQLEPLVFPIYLRYSWGAEFDSELRNVANALIRDAQKRGLHSDIEHAINLGSEAYKLTQHLESLLNTIGIEEAEKWF